MLSVSSFNSLTSLFLQTTLLFGCSRKDLSLSSNSCSGFRYVRTYVCTSLLHNFTSLLHNVTDVFHNDVPML